MATVAIIGGQWGDEGKGKNVDAFGKRARTFVRFQGGANAGHTLWIGGNRLVLHNLPSGIAHEGSLNLVGPYVLCDPRVLAEELALSDGFRSRVALDPRAPIVLEIHKQIDRGRERTLGRASVGTTGRGIGPGYEDFTARRGLTLADLASADAMRDRLEAGGYYAERRALCAHLGESAPTIDEVIDDLRGYAPRIVPHIADTVRLVTEAARDPKQTVVFEGAQGMMLDVLSGNRPFCTSSLCGPAAIEASFGIIPDDVYGVIKAYATRVGAGPFPTELPEDAADRLRRRAGEYGATTNRPRRIGWLDLPAVAFAARMGRFTKLIVNKIDVLNELTDVALCHSYMLDGESMHPLTTLTAPLLARAIPSYRHFEPWGWTQDLASCRRREDLPDIVQRYFAQIERSLALPIVGIGVGPGRDDLIWNE